MPTFSNPFSTSGGHKQTAATHSPKSSSLPPSRQNTPSAPIREIQPLTTTKVNDIAAAASGTNFPKTTTKRDRDLWREAVDQLDEKKRKALNLQFDAEGRVDPSASSVIEGIVDKVEKTCEDYKTHRLKIKHPDGRVIVDVRESAKKVLNFALRSKAITDAGVKFDPTGYSSAAWTVISLGLQLVQNDQDRLEAVFAASAKLADNLYRYANIEANYRSRELADIGHLEDKLRSCYEAILDYAGRVQQEQKRSFAGRVLYSFYSLSEQPLQQLQDKMLTADNALERWRVLIEHEYQVEEFKIISQALAKVDQILEDVNIRLMEMNERARSLEADLVKMATKEDINQIFAHFQQWLAEWLDRPVVSRANSESNQADGGVSANTDGLSLSIERDLGGLIQEVFVEFREFDESSEQHRKAIEQLPEMRPYRTRNDNQDEAEKIVKWAESPSSQLLWIDGNGVLGRSAFNSLFVGPLLIFGDSFESVLMLRHFCGDNPSLKANNHRTLLQALIIQVFKQRPRTFTQKAASLNREKTSDIYELWSLFLDCIQEAKDDCVFIIIDSIDYLQDSQTRDGFSERDIVIAKLEDLVKDSTMLVKILLTAKLSHESPASTEDLMKAMVVPSLPSTEPTRRLSLAIMQEELALIPQKLVEIQERRCQRVAFAHLPLLYPRHSIIYTFSENQLQAFIVSDVSGMDRRQDMYEPFSIRAWSIDHNGKQLAKRYHDFSVSQFRGEKVVTSLEYIPSGYLQDESGHRKELIARGRQYCKLANGVHYKQIFKRRKSIRLVIDQKATPSEMRSAYNFDQGFQVLPDQNLTPRTLMACPPTICAYNLEDGAWIHVLLNDVADIDFKPDMLDRLVFDSDMKCLARDLVQSHLDGMDTEEQEQVAFEQGLESVNKSKKGLTLLLHGGPGTGKSFTARCIAEDLQRPLLSDAIPVGDGPAMERRLFKLFQFAQKWRAILVLEDCEAFLSGRSDGLPDVVTSAMRAIDSYGGVLVLTTNRVGMLIEAIWSRIDLVINYPPLKKEAQIALWQNFVKTAREKDSEVSFVDIMNFISENEPTMNGRDIQNIMLAAGQLSEHRKETLSRDHIRVMLQIRTDFLEYLRSVKGVDEAENARERMFRDDRFGERPERLAKLPGSPLFPGQKYYPRHGPTSSGA